MRAFFSKYLFALIWVGAIIGVGYLFVYVIQSNLHIDAVSPSGVVRYVVTPAVAPATPTPSVSLSIIKGKNGNTLVVQWSNLPGNTTALDIFRGLSSKPSSTWSLYKSINLTIDQLASGHAELFIGNASLSGFSFFIEAVDKTGHGTASSTTGNTGGNILFTSTLIIPTDITPPPPSNNNPPPGPPSNQNNNPPNQPPTPPLNPPPTSTTQGTPPVTPTGTPYYNPQIQISGYGTDPTENFYVQHVDQKIRLNWQSLPSNTTKIAIYRSPNQDGPWSTVLTQENPNVTADSIQVVDNSLGNPFYYEMQAIAGSFTVATYGPVYLAP